MIVIACDRRPDGREGTANRRPVDHEHGFQHDERAECHPPPFAGRGLRRAEYERRHEQERGQAGIEPEELHTRFARDEDECEHDADR
jgi:hypothetical protein